MNQVKPKISCVILAGGQGKRVDGRDKGLIIYKGKPLIQHVIDAVAVQTHEIIISANRNVAQYEDFSYKVISDSIEGFQGPLSGMAATLPHCSNENVLIVPCDMPHLPSNLIKKVMMHISNTGMRVVEIENKLQMVFLMQKKKLPTIIHSLENDERRLMHWVKTQHPEIVNFQDAEAFTNYNYSTDFS